MKSAKSAFLVGVTALFGYLILLLPSYYNGAPLYWPDSIAYLHGGSSAVSVVTGFETRYVQIERVALLPAVSDAVDVTQADVPKTPMPPQDDGYRISSARSPYYSVALVSAATLGGPMFPVHTQAALIVLSLLLALKALFPRDFLRTAVYSTGALSITSAGVFATLLLPDFLAALAILAVGVMFASWTRLTLAEKIFWFLLLSFAVLSHRTHLAVVFLLLPICMLVVKVIFRKVVLGPSLLTAAAIATGILGGIVFSSVVEKNFGYKPHSFPMIAASIIVDGSGLDYLKATCPGNGFVYCADIDTQATEVDQYLWSTDPSVGVYALADGPTQNTMSQQQWSFLAETLKYDFWGQVLSSIKRMVRQICDNSLYQFYYDAQMRDMLSTLPEPDVSLARQSAAYGGEFPFQRLGIMTQYIAWACAFLVGICLYITLRARSDHHDKSDKTSVHPLVIVTLVVFCGLLINGGLTGAASQPQGRYSARILWLFPLLATMWSVWFWQNRVPAPNTAAQT